MNIITTLATLLIALAAMLASCAYALPIFRDFFGESQDGKITTHNSSDERERARNAHYMANLMNYDGEEQMEYNE